MPTEDDDKKEGNEPFLSRWSRRKREPAALPAGPQNAAPQQTPSEPEIDLQTLPKLDDLNASSDFTAFLKRGVPEALKQAALRKAWSSDPLIRDFIEVAENQYNFNDPNGVPGFGELAKDTDVAALVRQAIGEPEPKPVQVADAEVGSPSATPAATPEKNEQQTLAANQAEQISELAEPDISNETTSGKMAETAPSARRHGGALPECDGIG